MWYHGALWVYRGCEIVEFVGWCASWSSKLNPERRERRRLGIQLSRVMHRICHLFWFLIFTARPHATTWWWWWWSLPSGRRMSSGLTLYFLWVLEWPTRPILAVNWRPQSSQIKRLVSADLSAGTDWLVEPFRRLRFSTAVTIRSSSKCCTPVKQAFCHLDLLPARSSQAAGSMPVDSRLAFKLSLSIKNITPEKHQSLTRCKS